ncbi:MAG: hypothetical protein H6684_08365 [Deltaproteobacteria bacterium]|nr:hypothetical protein [bacterium]MCB9477469.1 hypothetical protein [Deltaproteobacteria bacterium]MCB9479286.1 hypothetical protein [Deltaproteobacteria bacterium]MCB9488730.1 hypothetical protein [Deltaproteobacteria bacterium]
MGKSKAKTDPNEDAKLLSELTTAAEQIGVAVRFERLQKGAIRITHGLCRVHEQDTIIIDSRLDPSERLGALTDEMASLDLSGIFVNPMLRERLERSRERQGRSHA